jgi:hypothetical protein
MLILTIVTIICIIILFKMFSKSTFSFENDNETSNANYPFCHPRDGKSVGAALPFTVSFDLYINDISKEKPSHLLTITDNSEDLDDKGCQPLKANDYWYDAADEFLLTLFISKNDNTLEIKSKLLDTDGIFKIKNLPVKKWFNIRIIVHQNRMLVFINSTLKYEYRVSEYPEKQALRILLSQYNGLYDGKMKNVKYTPYVEYYKEPLNIYSKYLDFFDSISYLI